MSKLQSDVPQVVNWFRVNQMVVNPGKFQFILIGCEEGAYSIVVDGHEIPCSKCVKLIGVTIDNKLGFGPHIDTLCSKADRKIKSLLRIRSNLYLRRASLLCDAYIMSCFRYCPLVWMFCSKGYSKKLEKINVRALRAVKSDFETPSVNMLIKHNSKSVHRVNLQMLAIEVFKSLNDLNPSFMSDFFTLKTASTDFRNGRPLKLPDRRECRTDSFVFRAVLLWNNLPMNLKQAQELKDFKKGIKAQKSLYCKCRICDPERLG